MHTLTETKTVLQLASRGKVDLFNCNCHTFIEVIERIVKAIGCSTQKATQLAHIVDQFGMVTVYTGDTDECERVASILGSIGLEVKVTT